MSCELSAERRHWTFKQGDEWHRSWSRTSGDRTYNNASLLVQIRAGSTSADTLVGSSDPAEATAGVVLIDVTATDLEAATPVFDWVVVDTTDIDADGTYWFEAECEIDGNLTTFLTHRMWVEAEIAVAGVGS